MWGRIGSNRSFETATCSAVVAVAAAGGGIRLSVLVLRSIQFAQGTHSVLVFPSAEASSVLASTLSSASVAHSGRSSRSGAGVTVAPAYLGHQTDLSYSRPSSAVPQPLDHSCVPSNQPHSLAGVLGVVPQPC